MAPDVPGADCYDAVGSLSLIEVLIQQIAIFPERKNVQAPN